MEWRDVQGNTLKRAENLACAAMVGIAFFLFGLLVCTYMLLESVYQAGRDTWIFIQPKVRRWVRSWF